MFIGASYQCSQYCEEEDKRKFDKYHTEHRHIIIDGKIFKEQNIDFMRKSKRAWNNFAIRLQSFFKKLKKEMEFIENQAFNRMDHEQIKTAINSNDKYLTKITTDIIQERYRNLTCKDINEFIQLRKNQQGTSQLKVEREEEEFADALIQQIQKFFHQISQDLKPIKTGIRDDNRNIRKDRQYEKVGRGPREEPHQIPRETKETREERPYPPRGKEEPHRITREDRPYPTRVREEGNDKPLRIRREKEEKLDQRPRKQPNKETKQLDDHQKGPRQQTRKAYGRGFNKGDEDRRAFRKRQDPQNHQKSQYEGTSKRGHREEESSRANEPCPIFKIADLTEGNKAFSIELKLINFIKSLHEKEVWKVCDETGEIKLVIPNHRSLNDGAKIFLKNCYVKAFNNILEIHTKIATTITGKDTKEEALKYDYSRQNRYNKNQEKDALKGRGLTKIQAINPESESLKIVAKIIKISTPQASDGVFKCVLGDETGIVSSQFKGFQQFLKEGNIVYFRGLDAEVKLGHIVLTGTKILMQMAHDQIRTIMESNNISGREYEQIDD